MPAKKPAAKHTQHTKPTPASRPASIQTARWKWLARWAGLPFLFYFVFFCFFTWPWIIHFNTHIFTDSGDGFQNVWNMWWVNYSVTHLHHLPWHTTMLHYPYGTTLIGQTLNPFNGFVAIPLLTLFSLSQTFNIMVIFSFVFGGMTAFWLCYKFSKKYIPSLIGGFIFTFSSYHFAHAIGHMQLVSLEWIPLFILLWWQLLTKPRYRTAVAAAIVLLLVLLCDYYYFLYSVLAAGMILIYIWHKKDLAPLKAPQTYRPFIAFLVIALLLCVPLPLKLMLDNAHDPFFGAHNANLFSTDLGTTVLDGGFWHFASLTHWYWRHVKAYLSEASVYFTISVLVLVVIAFWKRNKLQRDVVFWIVLGLVFAILSMGPRLLVGGKSYPGIPLPYAGFEHIFPQLKLSGDPDRFIVMAFLAAAVLSAIVLTKLDLRRRSHQAIIGVFFVVLCLEVWPAALPNTLNTYPKYVDALASLPYGAVVDNGAKSSAWQLYDQTVTEKPIAFGYISRTPTSVYNKDWQLTATILRGQYSHLCSEWGVRYFTTPAFRPLHTTFPIVYRDHRTLIYDLKDSPNC